LIFVEWLIDDDDDDDDVALLRRSWYSMICLEQWSERLKERLRLSRRIRWNMEHIRAMIRNIVSSVRLVKPINDDENIRWIWSNEKRNEFNQSRKVRANRVVARIHVTIFSRDKHNLSVDWKRAASLPDQYTPRTSISVERAMSVRR
jgi:hypothetical protein